MLAFPLRSPRHWQRYREISQVLLRHGFDQLVDLLEVAPLVSLPARLVRRRRKSDEGPGPKRLRRALEELGPTFIKLGQILSTRPDLVPPDYLDELIKLQDSAPPFPSDLARSLVEIELKKPIDALFASFESTPIAAASLGQVHRAVLPSGDCVVVKVQRPDIQRIINLDLQVLFDVARLAQQRTPLGRIYDFTEIAEEFADTLRGELDYEREGHNADRFRKNFAGDDAICIPRVYWEYTTRRVLVLEEIQGIKITDIPALDAAGIDRHRFAIENARILVQQIFKDHFFHADPHPGNFYVMPPRAPGEKPRTGVMDFGMVGWLDARTREYLLRMTINMVRQNVEAIVDQFVQMGVVEWGKYDRRRLERDLQRFLNHYRGMSFREWQMRDLVNDLMRLTFRHHLRFPSELWLLTKTLSMMEGLARQLDPSFDLFGVIEPYAHDLYIESLSLRAMGKRTVESLTDWGEELLLLPQQLRRMIEQFEQGSIQVTIRDEGWAVQFGRLDRMASRLAASLLIAAFVIAVTLLIPLLTNEPWRVFAAVLIIFAFVNATLLTIWLVLSSLPWRGR